MEENSGSSLTVTRRGREEEMREEEKRGAERKNIRPENH